MPHWFSHLNFSGNVSKEAEGREKLLNKKGKDDLLDLSRKEIIFLTFHGYSVFVKACKRRNFFGQI